MAWFETGRNSSEVLSFTLTARHASGGPAHCVPTPTCQKFLPDVFRRNTGHIAAAVDRSLKKMVLIVTDWNERSNQGGWELDDVSRWLLGQTFIPHTNQPYRFNVIDVGDACFFDQGRTTEIYLPHQPRNQKLPILRNWARGERPCIGAGCRHRPWPPDQSGGNRFKPVGIL